MPVISGVLTLLLPLNLMAATLLFFGPPILYLSLRRQDMVLRTLVYSTAIMTISILSDYLAEQDRSWVSTTMFDFRVAGVVPIEALIWLFMFTYLIVAFNQYFFDSEDHPVVGKRMPIVFITAGVVLAWACLTAVWNLHFTVDYFYIKFGLLFLLLPLIIFLMMYPRYRRRLALMVPYFFVIGMMNLLISLHKDHWAYPGEHYIGWMQLGPYGFPVEEFVFWIILYAPFLISQFELFNNDNFDIKSKPQ